MNTKEATIEFAYIKEEDDVNFEYVTFRVHISESFDYQKAISIKYEAPEKKIEISESDFDEAFKEYINTGTSQTFKEELGFK